MEIIFDLNCYEDHFWNQCDYQHPHKSCKLEVLIEKKSELVSVFGEEEFNLFIDINGNILPYK